MSQHRCATCLKPLEPQRLRAGEILCPTCESEWRQHLPKHLPSHPAEPPRDHPSTGHTPNA